MTNRKISQLTALTTPAAGDYLPIVDISEAAAADQNKRITIEELLRGAPDGTAAAPSIAFESDPNTGIYRPGADQVAISTNGTAKLTVGATQSVLTHNLLLDTTNANASLLVRSNVANGGAGFSEVYLGNTSTATRGYISYAHATDSLAFGTSGAERLRITSDGKVGLGTSSPAQLLHVKGSGDVKLLLNSTNNASDRGIYFATGTDSEVLGYIKQEYSTGKFEISSGSGTYASNISFRTGGTADRVVIDSSGRVGVGTTTVSHQLDVVSASTAVAEFSGPANATVEFKGSGFVEGKIQCGGEFTVGSTNNYPVAFAVNGTERARIDSSGRLGIGTSSPTQALELGTAGGSAGNILMPANATLFSGGELYIRAGSSGKLRLGANNLNSLVVVDTNGRLGIGTSSPNDKLEVAGAILTTAPLAAHQTSMGVFEFNGNVTSIRSYGATAGTGQISFNTGGGGGSADSLAMRIDSSQRVLVGTTSALTGSRSQYAKTVVVNNSLGGNGPGYFSLHNGATAADIGSNGEAAYLTFGASDADYAWISAFSDGATSGTGDTPGRLSFHTSADGSSTPTERMRIKSDGTILFAKTSNVDANSGVTVEATGLLKSTRSGGSPFLVNRTTNDGTLVQFLQDGTEEGTISVSGTTVQLNGAHLSRWSQLPGNAERTEILRGSVLSNLDEMCEWAYDAEPEVLWAEGDELPEGVSVGDVKTPAKAAGTELNEQLNRMKVSDVEGDPNVAGVFVAWDDDDDTYTNDFYCAMTGDFVIRIAQGVTVERGDLLMSAGDGTAKPQDDDIIRSKTIAKVTSTNVSCTYDDGSYCVPCVLMAC